MKEKSEKEENFYLEWEKRRKKKWLYVFLHGSIYWGGYLQQLPYFY